MDDELDRLTAREREVMRLIARGYAYREVGTELFISVKTVETHVSSVLRKLQLIEPARAEPVGGRAADRLSALVDVVDRLRCPVCAAPLALAPGPPQVLGCAAGHRFDVARQGHVVLVPGGSKLRADTSDMVAARVRVHASGAFDGVREALVGACAASDGPSAGDLGGPAAGPTDGLLADLGAGPGTWAAAVLDALPRPPRRGARAVRPRAARRGPRPRPPGRRGGRPHPAPAAGRRLGRGGPRGLRAPARPAPSCAA